MKKIGNLFELARQSLEKRNKQFTNVDVIDVAIELRHRLDDIELLKHRKANKKYYINNKIG